jgi:hypothetical protein
MTNANFSPIPDSLYVQDVSDTAAGIGAANIPASARYAEGHVRLASLSETREGSTNASIDWTFYNRAPG